MGFVKSYPWCANCEICLPWNGDPSERCPYCNKHPRLGPRHKAKLNSRGSYNDDGWSNLLSPKKVTTKQKRKKPKVVKENLQEVRDKLKRMFGENDDDNV